MYNNILHVLSLFLSQQITVNKCTLLDCTNSVLYTDLQLFSSLSQSPRQGIVMKTSFETQVSRMGLGSFVNINIFVISII